MAEYVLASAADEIERRRMALLFSYHGRFTIDVLAAAGVSAGWRCLEVGAGGGDITRWLAQRVAPGGAVLAVDLETRWVEPLAGDVVQVRRGDVLQLDLDAHAHDLLVAQMLLLHLPDPAPACRRFVDLVKPGGQIVVHDADFSAVTLADASEPEAHGLAVMVDVMRDARVDTALGPKVAALLEAAGATIEQVVVRPCETTDDARAAGEITAITLERFRDRSRAPVGALDAAVAALRDPGRHLTGPTRWIVRARVPS